MPMIEKQLAMIASRSGILALALVFVLVSTIIGFAETREITDVHGLTGTQTVEKTESGGNTLRRQVTAANTTSGDRTTTIRKGGERTVKRQKIVDGHWQDVAVLSPSLAVTSNSRTIVAPQENGGLTPTNAASEGGSAPQNRVYVPPLAGPNSMVTGTFEDDESAEPGGFYVATFDERGKRSIFKGRTDEHGRFRFAVLAGIATFEVFRHFDRGANPANASRCEISTSPAAHVVGTETVTNAARSGAALTGAATSYQRGATFNLQTEWVDAESAAILVDNNPNAAEVLAASDRSIVGRIAENAPLGRHALAVRSHGMVSNRTPSDIIDASIETTGPHETGSVQTVTLHVNGLPVDDQATAHFHVTGSAQLEQGGEDAMVPVQNGSAQVHIRGVRAGQAIVRWNLHVVLANAIAQEVSPLPSPTPKETANPKNTPKPKITPGHAAVNVTPTPNELVTPKPLFTGGGLKIVVTPTPSPTEIPPPPILHRHEEQLEPCSLHVVDGYMQPTQGFWQDDRRFPQPDVLIRLGNPGEEPFYKAPYPLVVDRPTVIGGVYHYRWVRTGQDVFPDDRDDPKGNVVMTVSSNCPLFDAVRFHFSFVERNAGTVWQNNTIPLGYVPLHGKVKAGAPFHLYSVKLPVPLGYPEFTAFEAPSPGFYSLFCALEMLDPATGRWVGPLGDITVNIEIVRTRGPIIHFVPVVLFAAPEDVDFTGNELETAALHQARDTSHLLPDLYPLKPGGDMKTSSIPSQVENYKDFTGNDAIAHPERHLNIPADFRIKHPDLVELVSPTLAGRVRRDAINAELARIFDLGAVLSHAGRIVVVFDRDDFRTVAGPGVVAYTLSTKVVFAPDNASYQDIGHEIVHTLPWDTARGGAGHDVTWMNAECALGYHNLHGDYAQGLRFIHNGGRVDRRNDEQGAAVGIMGPYAPDAYMEQCTSRHLTQKLRGIPDPQVIVVRGMLITNGRSIAGSFDPFYRTTSEADQQKEDPNFHLRLVLRGAGGSLLRSIPVQTYLFGPEDTSYRTISSFMVRVPVVAELRSIELRAGNDVLDVRLATPSAPTVTIVAPQRGAVERARVPFDLVWSARSRGHAALAASIFESRDGGRSFEVRAVDQSITRYRLLLRGAGAHILRVFVSDGWQSSQAETQVLVH